ncbi:MAG: hypothetical protein AAFR67_04220, partial [Chloroflexota bacterium]
MPSDTVQSDSELMTPNTDSNDLPHILIVVSHVPGQLFGALGLAEYLRDAGYTISFCSYDNQQATIEANGYPFYLTSDLYGESALTWQGGTRLSRLINGVSQLRTIKQRRHEAIHWEAVQHFQKTIAEAHPDLILVDTELPAHTICAGTAGIPIAVFNRMLTMQKYPNVPPLHFPNIPNRGRSGSFWGIEWAWLKYRLIKGRRFWTRKLRKILADKTSVLAHLAHEFGFDFGKYVQHYQWAMPFSFRLPTVNLTALELELPHTPRDFYHYAGALITQDRHTTHETDPRLQAILDHHTNDNSSKLIYCASGTYYKGDDQSLWHRLIAVAQSRPDWQFVFGLGGRFEVDKLGKLPENVLALNWIPQLQVLEKADCAVIATGINTVLECVHYEVPMLAYPLP